MNVNSLLVHHINQAIDVDDITSSSILARPHDNLSLLLRVSAATV